MYVFCIDTTARHALRASSCDSHTEPIHARHALSRLDKKRQKTGIPLYIQFFQNIGHFSFEFLEFRDANDRPQPHVVAEQFRAGHAVNNHRRISRRSRGQRRKTRAH